MNTPENSQDAQPQKAKSALGLSPVTYGLGESVKTGLWGLLGAGLIATLLVRFGEGKIPGMLTLAEIPEKISSFFRQRMGVDKATNWGRAIVVGFSIGTLASWITHLPGLVHGIMKVNKEEKKVAATVRENQQLTQTTKLLAEENAELKAALEKIQRRDPYEGRNAEAVRSL